MIPSAALQAPKWRAPSTHSPVRKWLHHHPLVTQIAVLALLGIGLSLILNGGKKRKYSEIAAGALMNVLAFYSNKMLPVFIPPAMKQHRAYFTPGECKGVTLKYEEGLPPVLHIPKQASPFDAGYARGYLMAVQIKEMISKNDFAFHTLRGLPRKIPHLITQMRKVIPTEMLAEMEGVAIGYMQRRSEWRFFKGLPLTSDMMVYFHLLPDIGHLNFVEANRWAEREVMGCSVIIDGTAKTGPCVMRTVDWTALDIYGKYSFIERRDYEHGMKTVGQSLPLFVGALTGMNNKGFGVTMNVAIGLSDYPVRMPAAVYLRKLLETCDGIKGENGAQQFWEKNDPLGPFNMSVFDKENAAAVHFFQGKGNSHTVRWWEPGKELVVLNFRMGEKGPVNATPTNSAQRIQAISRYYQEIRDKGLYESMSPEQRVKHIAKDPEVNNIRTISVTYMQSKEMVMENAFDNGYAADIPLAKLPMHNWFEG